jgi:hypothetical protein
MNKTSGDMCVKTEIIWQWGRRLNILQGLIMKWLADPTSRVTPLNAHESGHLGFKPGQYVSKALCITFINTLISDGGFIRFSRFILALLTLLTQMEASVQTKMAHTLFLQPGMMKSTVIVPIALITAVVRVTGDAFD